MKRSTYEANLAKTVVVDTMTVAEAKAAKRQEKALERFWKKEALAHILKTTGRDLKAEEAGWTILRFGFSLKPTGTIKIEQRAVNDHTPTTFLEEFSVPKKALLK